MLANTQTHVHRVNGDPRGGRWSVTRSYCMCTVHVNSRTCLMWFESTQELIYCPTYFFFFFFIIQQNRESEFVSVVGWLVSETCCGSSSASPMYSTGSGSGIYLANVGKKTLESTVSQERKHGEMSSSSQNFTQYRKLLATKETCLRLERCHGDKRVWTSVSAKSFISISWIFEGAGPPVFVFQKVSACPRNVQTVKRFAPSVLPFFLCPFKG